MQAGFQVRADVLGVFLEIFGFNDVRGHREGVAAVGVEVNPAGHHLGDVGSGGDRTERRAVADALGQPW